MERITFTKKVLGPMAGYRLMKKQVVQTFRSKHEVITQAALQGFVKSNDTVEIFFDGIFIGYAAYLLTTPTHWDALNENDAKKGGFDTMEDLEQALQRAGFRFRPMNDYQLYRTEFKWLEGKGA